jgi:hypothetical protein
MKHYFATDGNYGDAEDILVIDSDLFTNEDWINISEELDSYRIDLAKSIYQHRLKEAGL